MAIAVRCECGREFKAKDEHAGRKAVCSACHRELYVPVPNPLIDTRLDSDGAPIVPAVPVALPSVKSPAPPDTSVAQPASGPTACGGSIKAASAATARRNQSGSIRKAKRFTHA